MIGLPHSSQTVPVFGAVRLFLLQKDFTVLIEISSSVAMLPYPAPSRRGIYCGMTAQDIIDAYGQPSFSYNGKNSTMDTSIVYEVEDRIDLIFDLLNNKITCIRFGEFD